MRNFCGTVVSTIFLLSLSAQSFAQDALTALLAQEQSVAKLIEQHESGVVSILKYKRRNPPPPNLFGIQEEDTTDPDHPDFVPNEFGTGILIQSRKVPGETFVLTNYHVVRNGPVFGKNQEDIRDRPEFLLHLKFANRRSSSATIFAADPRSDLAVLKVTQPNAIEKLKPFSIDQAIVPRKGQFVITMGNPYAIAKDGSPSVSFGMVSNLTRRPVPLDWDPHDSESRNGETIHHFGTLIQVDARLNLGTSGGALMTLKGELAGITTSLAALEGYEKSAGYAIPFDDAMQRVIGSLVQGYEVEYGFLGIKPDDVNLSELPGVLPGSVKQSTAVRVGGSPIQNSPAAGVLEHGDMILQVNQTTVYGKYDLMREIGEAGPAETPQEKTRLLVLRGSPAQNLQRIGPPYTLKQFEILLGKWPVLDDEGIIAPKQRFPGFAGITIDYPSSRNRFLRSNANEFFRGVLVTEIQTTSPLAITQGPEENPRTLQPGDWITFVNNRAVTTPAEFYAALPNRGSVNLQVARKGIFTLKYSAETAEWTVPATNPAP